MGGDAGRALNRRTRPVWLLVSAAWLVPAILAALKEYVSGLVLGGDRPGARRMLFEGGDWLLLAFGG